jgi:hypothetical protein
MRLDPAVEQRVARWATGHHAHVRRVDALRLGHTRHTLDRSRATGVLVRKNDRVLMIAGAPDTPEGDLYAAVFGGTDEGVASHLSAAALYGWRRHPPVPHLTVPYGRGTRGIAIVHRSNVPAIDRTVVGVIPATTPARTVVDCATVLSGDALDELVDAALVSGKVGRKAIEAAADRASVRPGRKGDPDLRRSLDIWNPGIERDSIPEARLFRLVRSWGHPEPVPLYVVRDHAGLLVCELDVAWPDYLAALEYDAPATHNPRVWSRDERRCGGAERLGWTIVPVDKTDLMPGGHARLRSILDRLLQPRADDPHDAGSRRDPGPARGPDAGGPRRRPA